ncbi:MAG: hypothetical protein BRC47_06965 [Cyanobacteria bacterium QS_7_48_42]|jgi:hypothetical protein|nr:MAG: hypothetical protein BRC34_05960 [Cyanobacteria bacterium QH_1_48_107]PSO60838.1 MAG: hypothetical protein BRC39_09175 [Cyanobacteria bacterium QH_7_48_89]PSO67567.1 MAG: hypothetical protein BRC38_02995 [Cyanobacteria bacterium QH_6_48_35]PSO70023.1 MAG: hypothetical protein BRC37_16585 [Cyanobacteria bacterium QH_3_48_40]PSO71442.1 MAG: hypothetical protein BRC42_08030 [Cyanobacteria bacterium QS_1_48_34]PSO80314.1 MAG: hypothetical protein BRC44_06640 [Cyanobacteria bacterium QS_4_4
MSRVELRAYLFKHRDNQEAFQTYMDKLATEPVLASGTQSNLEDVERFRELLERVQQSKQEGTSPDTF